MTTASAASSRNRYLTAGKLRSVNLDENIGVKIVEESVQPPDIGQSVNLPGLDTPCFRTVLASLERDFEPSTAGVNSGYPRLRIGSLLGSSLAAVAVDNPRVLSPVVGGWRRAASTLEPSNLML